MSNMPPTKHHTNAKIIKYTPYKQKITPTVKIGKKTQPQNWEEK